MTSDAIRLTKGFAMICRKKCLNTCLLKTKSVCNVCVNDSPERYFCDRTDLLSEASMYHDQFM